jgi:hypothetical protein
MREYLFYGRHLTVACMFGISIFFSSCYSYRVATQAQAGTETLKTITAHSLFWGLLKNPKEIHTPVCDSLGSTGMAEVNVKSNFGFSLITVVTLGIWSPIKLECKCSKT